MENMVSLAHGDGGRKTNDLIRGIFYKYFGNPILLESRDSAIFTVGQGRMAFTTDSFVVKPVFFKGGDIGKLAVCGTINDLVAAGALPLYLSAGFIIEEGFELGLLEKITDSMARTCRDANVKIIAGDTKVVEKGEADKIFINTSGVGIVYDAYTPRPIGDGDEIIITGTIAEHGTAIALDRYKLKIKGDIRSDCNPLHLLVASLGDYLSRVKMMTDPTRGGLATVLNEIAGRYNVCIMINEDKIPIRQEVWAVTELLGLDPLYLASEGRMVLVVERGYGLEILNHIRKIEGYEKAELIGSCTKNGDSLVCLKTRIGGSRVLNMLDGRMLPRIC